MNWRDKWWAPIPVWRRSRVWRQGYYAGILTGISFAIRVRRVWAHCEVLRKLLDKRD